jgi:hypothetical protein
MWSAENRPTNVPAIELRDVHSAYVGHPALDAVTHVQQAFVAPLARVRNAVFRRQ